MNDHVHTLEEYVSNLTIEARQQYRLNHPGEVGKEHFALDQKSYVENDTKVQFFIYHTEFLLQKLDDMQQGNGNSDNEMKEVIIIDEDDDQSMSDIEVEETNDTEVEENKDIEVEEHEVIDIDNDPEIGHPAADIEVEEVQVEEMEEVVKAQVEGSEDKIDDEMNEENNNIVNDTVLWEDNGDNDEGKAIEKALTFLKTKTIHIQPRTNTSLNMTKAAKRRFKREKQKKSETLHNVLLSTGVITRNYMQHPVKVRCSVSNRVMIGKVHCDPKEEDGVSEGNKQLSDCVGWRIAFDSTQVDMFVDTECLEAMSDLNALGDNLYSAPLSENKNNKKRKIENNESNSKHDYHYSGTFDVSFNVGSYSTSMHEVRITTNSEQRSSSEPVCFTRCVLRKLPKSKCIFTIITMYYYYFTIY